MTGTEDEELDRALEDIRLSKRFAFAIVMLISFLVLAWIVTVGIDVEPVRVIPSPTPFPTQESYAGTGIGNGVRLSGDL